MNQNAQKKKTILWIAAICILCVGIFYFFKPLVTSTSFPDFSSYYYGSLAGAHGENPYAGGEHFFTPFVYPPSLLLFFYPFTIFPYTLAERIFTAISMLAYCASMFILDYLFTHRHPLILRIMGLGFLLATFFPAKFTFGMGQINSIVLLFITLFLYFSKKRDDLTAGIFLALSISTKLFPGALILFLMFQKKWRLLFFTFCSLAAIGIITLYATGTSVVWTFFSSILPHLLLSPKTDYYNQSIPGMIARLIADPNIAQPLTWLYSVALLLPLLAFSDLREEMFPLGSILSIVSSLLINTFAWQHHFILILPAFFILLSKKYLSNNLFYTIFLGFSYIMIAANVANPHLLWKPLWSHLTYGGMILWGILVYKVLVSPPNDTKRVAHI